MPRSVSARAPAASAITLPPTCTTLLTADQVGAAVAMEGITEREAPLLMPVLLNAGADADAGADAALACSWSNRYTSAVPMPIGVTVLPGAGCRMGVGERVGETTPRPKPCCRRRRPR